jgi:hypothetical protein
VQSSLVLGAVLVAIVLFLFLLDLRTALISFSAIPLSLLTALIVLDRFGATINTMTLGGLAVAIGVVVDDAIIDVENILRRLRDYIAKRTATVSATLSSGESEKRSQPGGGANASSSTESGDLPSPLPDGEGQGEGKTSRGNTANSKSGRRVARCVQVVLNASLEVRSAVVYASFIVALVFLPVLTMSGLQGRFFAPLGIAFILGDPRVADGRAHRDACALFCAAIAHAAARGTEVLEPVEGTSPAYAGKGRPESAHDDWPGARSVFCRPGDAAVYGRRVSAGISRRAFRGPNLHDAGNVAAEMLRLGERLAGNC